MAERQRIQRIAKAVAQANGDQALLQLGIGDDAAVTSVPSPQLTTTDMLMDGVHFVVGEAPWALIGRKCLAVSLSDIAAMGGWPRMAYLSVAWPKSLADQAADEFQAGFLELATEFGVALAGGDTNFWSGPLVVNVTVVGTAGAGGVISRGGARPGDIVCVTGALGDSLKTGEHLRFVPRVREVAALVAVCQPTAMVDISDGLATDLGHVLAASGVGACLDLAALPMAPTLGGLGREEAVRRALTDGEDFELCMTLRPEDAAGILAQNIGGCPVIPIGVVEAASGLRGRWPGEEAELLAVKGYEHGLS